MATKIRHALSQLGIIGGGESAFAGGNDLHRMETEHADRAVAAVPHGATLVMAADGMAGILHNGDPVVACQRSDGLHCTAGAAQMHGH